MRRRGKEEFGMTKKEFRKKCREEKTQSYKLTLAGTIVALLGLIVVIAVLLFIKTFSSQITGFVIGIVLALVGMGLDIARRDCTD